MYPTLSDLIFDLTGLEIPLPVQTFGFMLAISFLLAAYTLTLDLKRKEKLGIFKPVSIKVKVGEKATFSELMFAFIPAFLIGWKLAYAFSHYSEFVAEHQGVLLSMKRSVPAGVLLWSISTWLGYRNRENVN